ncbi:TPA: LysR family transcriptional regulator, partial [Neisseria bacilliformis]
MELNNLNDMTAFVASVKSGSFTAAAKQLGLTRSTIGKRIARLEARLNVRLLQRNTRNLAPTDEGRLFYERCTAVLEELENAEQCLAQRSI